jgi:hypothetical protein
MKSKSEMKDLGLFENKYGKIQINFCGKVGRV